MNQPTDDLYNAKTINLVTYRRNGKAVHTPVWCARHGQYLYAFSNGQAGKVKRLRRSTQAMINPCSSRGVSEGRAVGASAFLVGDPQERAFALAAIRRKYGITFIVLGFFAGLAGRRKHWAVIRIEPDTASPAPA